MSLRLLGGIWTLVHSLSMHALNAYEKLTFFFAHNKTLALSNRWDRRLFNMTISCRLFTGENEPFLRRQPIVCNYDHYRNRLAVKSPA